MSGKEQERHAPADNGNDNTCVTIETALQSYDKLIRFAAHRVYQAANGACSYLSVDDLYQEGAMLLMKQVEQYGLSKSTEEFGYIFKKSLWRHMRQTAFGNVEDTVPLETVNTGIVGRANYDNMEQTTGADPEDKGAQDALLEVEVQEKVETLKSMLGQYGQTRLIELLEELIEPSERALWQAEMHHARVKTVREQGHHINQPQTFKVTLTNIRMAMGVEPKMFDNMLSKLRQYASYVFDVMEDPAYENSPDEVKRTPVLMPVRTPISGTSVIRKAIVTV